MAGRRRKGPNDEDPQARQRNLRDIELEDLRRQVQQLEQRLARGKHREYDVDGHDSDGGSTNNDVDFNPFHDDNSRDRASRGPQFRRDNVRNKSFDFKVDIPDFEGRNNPNEFIDWLNSVERVFEFKDVQEDSKKDLSVEDYVAEFENLMMRCDVLEPEEQIIARFLGGLRYEIGNVLALKVEKQKKESSRFGGRFSSGGGASNRGSASASKNTPVAKDIKQKSAASKDGGAGFVKSSEYDEENEETTPIYDECDKEEDITYEDHGEALVIRRSLNTTYVPDDSWLRNNIFHTRCTSNGKVCDIIVDRGSCENVVATTMVEKLQLKTKDHPRPYKLSLLRKGNEVKVNKRCLVQFSIGDKYKDEVWCDVIPMDVCHLLLERPWQFDRKTQHDGFKNTYAFVKDGKKIILGPSRMKGIVKPSKEEGNNMLSQTQLEDAMNESFAAFALVVLEENEESNIISLQVQPLLQEFTDVVPEEIPPGLPPMRNIQHCIDLIPGASIPNNAAYRMNPKEHEELKRQVEDLLARGLVQESKSPCVIPALLVLKKNGSWRMCVDSRELQPKRALKYLRQVFGVLREQKLYANLKKCHFFTNSLIFLGYNISSKGIKMDRDKIEAILNWPIPKTIHDIRSFHSLASFYRKFIKNFSTLIAPITECLKGGSFKWTEEALKSFELLKKKSHGGSNFATSRFRKGVRSGLRCFQCGDRRSSSQEGRPIAFFSEMMNSRRNYSTYDKEFFAIVRTLDHWQHYLLHNEFVLFSDHEA
ncbi:uncharacterized protein LOC122019314 [Zingiber officinale]|uniref:uncharacterized protein LOC122019314 n=1 Tax=Zingiber officinale TaxID=94328 RepID=UPI001C4D73C9|nr:uncharacterized protein LOC122019314 [Zingiber officinale]